MGGVSDGGHRTSTIPRPEPGPGARGPRRRPVRDAAPAPAPSPATSSDRRDLTTPIPIENQLARARSSKLFVGLIGLVVVAALAAALFVLPVRDWLRQRDDLSERQAELDILEQANATLQREVDRLHTPEGIEEAARVEIGYIGEGEQRMSVLPLPDAPTTLPAGWPYDQVAQIIAVRAAEVTAVDAEP